MNPLEELKLHVESLVTAVEQDPRIFAPVINYVRRLRDSLADADPSLAVADLSVLARNLERFWSQCYQSPDEEYYSAPANEVEETAGTTKEIVQLVAKLKKLTSEEWKALVTTWTTSNTSRSVEKASVHSPCIFVGHGRSKLWARLQVHLKDDLHLEVINYESESRVGESIVPVLEKMLAEATFAILVCTGEDDTAMGAVRARQNVIHEAGLFQGRLGFKKVVLLMQEGIEEFSNVAGLQHIPFSGERIEQTFYELGRALKRENQIS